MISVGMGGVLTEIYQDMAMRPAPVNLDTANQMIAQVKGAVVLNGYRGKPMADTGALAEVIVAVSTLAAHERVLEAEINPLIVCADQIDIVILAVKLGANAMSLAESNH
jgi:succinyl-CoA synthetase beta subunit